MKRVIIESPYAAPPDTPKSQIDDVIAANVAYAKRAIMDCLRRGEAPLASHLLFTQDGILRDAHPKERILGIDAGHAWLPVAEAVVFYMDRGKSPGMQQAWDRAEAAGIPCIERRLPPEKP